MLEKFIYEKINKFNSQDVVNSTLLTVTSSTTAPSSLQSGVLHTSFKVDGPSLRTVGPGSVGRIVGTKFLNAVCVAQRVQRMFTAAQAWRNHGNLKKKNAILVKHGETLGSHNQINTI